MKVQEAITLNDYPEHSVEFGESTFGDPPISIRNRYDKGGQFSPHRSSEMPIHDLRPMVVLAAERDYLEPAAAIEMAVALLASAQRKLGKLPPLW